MKTIFYQNCHSKPSVRHVVYRESGIWRRSRKAVHWLKRMLLEPEERRLSSSCRRAVILDDSTQFFSTSTWNLLSVGAVMSSCLLTVFLQKKDSSLLAPNLDTWLNQQQGHQMKTSISRKNFKIPTDRT